MKTDMADDNSDDSAGDLPLDVVRGKNGKNGKNGENGSNAHTSSDNSEKPNAIDRDNVKDNENPIIRKGEEDTKGMDKIRVIEPKSEQTTNPHSSSAPVPLPPLFPLGDVPQRITPGLLLAALREEHGIPDPDTIHRDCYDAMSVLKAEGILSKYVLSEDEAAVLCAIPMLVQLKSDPFSMQKMVESCNAKTPSKLFVIMLIALRKLPRYKGIMYIESEVQSEGKFVVKKRMEHDIIQGPIYIATKGMSSASGTTDTASPREVFRVEEGWGYDISDFALGRDESGRCVISYGGDIVIIEPWQGFEVMNSGIYQLQERISIVPVEKVDSELAYCSEIVPNVSSHAIRIMREKMDDVNVLKNMLSILTACPFNTQYDNRTTFENNGGIECLVDCYNKHNALAKEVVICLENAIIEKVPAFLLNKGFIKAVADLTFENIDDPVLCQSSSAIIKATCCTFMYGHNFDKIFQDIRGFELIFKLLSNHITNSTICSNMLVVLRIILSFSNDVQLSIHTLALLYCSGIIEILDFITEEGKDETLIRICNTVFSAIYSRVKEFGAFDTCEHAVPLYHQIKTTKKTNNKLGTNEERLKELPKKLSNNNEIITGGDIKVALQGIGISDSKKILDESKKVYVKNKDILNKSYILSEEEAIVIASYTYEDEESIDLSPYRIINKKLRDENIQDQEDNKKSYLQLLLRALRKLPRTKPQTLYRGVSDDKRRYVKNGEVEWRGFSSTTTTMEKAQSFITNKETNEMSGTLFEVRNVWGYNIKEFSHFKEDEVLLEPMMKFVTKDVKKEGSLTRVVLEPKEEQPLFLFKDSIPPSCTQYIISNLKSSVDLKEICRMCGILCKVYMDDETSPDSRRMFREHGGSQLLCDLFKKHKKFRIAEALVHAMDPRDEITNGKYVGYISEAIHASSTEETIDVEANLLFLYFIESLNTKNIKITISKEEIKGISILVNKFVDNKSLCLKALKTISFNFIDTKDSHQIMLDALIMTKKIVKTHLSDSVICKVGCPIITRAFTLLTNNEHREQVDCLKVVMEVMKMHIDDADVCMDVCNDFCIMVKIKGVNQEEARRLNDIKIVLDATNKHNDDEITCAYGCGTLSEMIHEIQDNQIIFDVIKTVLKVTKAHINNEKICHFFYKTLPIAIYIYKIRDNQIIIDVIETALKVTKIHVNNEELCYFFYMALPAMICDYDIQDNQLRIDIIITMLNTINKCIDNEETCNFFCSTLHELIHEIQDCALKAGVVETVLNAINTHVDNGEICKSGCAIFLILFKTNSIVQKIAWENGCVDILLKVLEIHADNEDIRGICCGTLSVVLSSQDLHSRYCTDDALSIIGECYANTKIL